MEKSLLYVSRSLLTTDHAEELGNIVTVSRSRNAKLRITGALISTSTGFAQILEGNPVAIDALMESINRDQRHTEVKVIKYSLIDRRQFPNWSMAYAGPATYFSNLVSKLQNAGAKLSDSSRAAFGYSDAEKLQKIMREFAANAVDADQ